MLNLTPLLRLYASFRSKKLVNLNPAKAQARTLLKLVDKAKDTKFGQNHDFSTIKSVADFQNAVPLRKYENFWNDYWSSAFPVLNNCTWPGSIKHFCVSSGTSSGRTKYIPCSKEMLASNSQSGLDLLVHHVNYQSSSSILGGKCFFLGGSTALKQEHPGIYSGDLSGIQASQLPWWATWRYFPPKDLALLADWEQKIDRLAKAALEQDIRLIGGVPSWLLIFFERVFDLANVSERKIVEVFPKLQMLVHGGVNFEPYKLQFEELLRGSQAETREVYPASEGFIAIADRGYGEGLKLNLDNGLFFEFVPIEELEQNNPTRHWVETIEPNVQYAVVLSSCAGLWSYIIGDTVKFVDTTNPRLLVTGRTSYMLSAFGEHLIGEEIEKAIAESAHAIRQDLVEYVVGPIFPKTPAELGGHLFVLEFKEIINAAALSNFLDVLDAMLCQLNEDYEAHRAQGFGLKPPSAIVVEPGSFKKWMKSQGKLGGQHKVPRIISTPDQFNGLVEYQKQHTVIQTLN